MIQRCVGYSTATIVSLLAAPGCANTNDFSDDHTDGGTGGFRQGRGGTGGSSTGGSGSSSGAGGSTDGGSGGTDLSDGGLAQFSAVLEGDRVRLSSSDGVWIERCQRNPRLVQQDGDAWTPLRDDRPEAYNLLDAAHYLDGSFRDACRLTLGCDVGGCAAFSTMYDPYVPLVAREFVQVGQASAPTCDQLDAGIEPDAGSDAGVRQVPNIESRAPTSAIGVEIRYYRDSRCRTGAITTVVPVE
jgi:hypothetical protein